MKSQPVTITATYRIVTPMFCAGADQQSAELRLPSFKGALRFWWRSLVWGRVADHRELQDKEAALFGASDKKYGQSMVRLRLIQNKPCRTLKKGRRLADGDMRGAAYLGYGVMNHQATLTRAALADGEFTVECRVSRFAKEELVDELQASLALLGTIGGLGSKARKGYGSLTLTQLTIHGNSKPLPSDPAERLKEVLGDLSDRAPNWTAWCKQSRVVVTNHASAPRPLDVLDALGREQVHFRSWGRDGKVLGQPSEQNFRTDHDLSKERPANSDYPYRVAFGLPHNYGKGPQKEVAPRKHDRRASPLFMHVHQVHHDSPPCGVVAFLPAQFLPADEQVRAFGRNVNALTDNAFWFPVHGFLDRLAADSSPPKTRPGYENFSNDNWWMKQTSVTGREVNLG